MAQLVLECNCVLHHILRDKHCQFEGCTSSERLEVHHIIPRRLGGSEHPKNLITLCRKHHKIQPAHHYDAPLVLSNIELATFKLSVSKEEKERIKFEEKRARYCEYWEKMGIGLHSSD